ncbi:hypothetical protein CTAM01_07785 [Colletotrichum tamarilloi]|uniref:Uncharacterized protein n=1 Tax=Colletotrichum tamarilloi TaxID=1209934 RepID=A0ABQ9R7Y9_9PEZI|nr:uncharacterized protein CTAM01_07785 [Colletotrichum tamarilloi]KAK1497515.1 hypothetical protein CTAM01_07785 [Colletotrichum tamarilloi]
MSAFSEYLRELCYGGQEAGSARRRSLRKRSTSTNKSMTTVNGGSKPSPPTKRMAGRRSYVADCSYGYALFGVLDPPWEDPVGLLWRQQLNEAGASKSAKSCHAGQNLPRKYLLASGLAAFSLRD